MLSDKYTVVPEGLNVTIDVPEAIAGLQKALAEKGADHVEGKCAYTHYRFDEEVGGRVPVEPGCIVGNFLHQHGITIGIQDDLGTVFTIADELRPHGFRITSDALDVLREAQHVQDQKRPWGVAVDRALAMAERVAARTAQEVSA